MNIAIIGQGGHGKVIKDLILSDERHRIVGFLDDKYEDAIVRNHTYFGPIFSIDNLIALFRDLQFIVGIGDNKVRKQIVQTLRLPDERYATLIHQSAVVSPSAMIGAGTVAMARSVINADAQIGRHTIINTGSVVEHDNVIGDFVHVSPNAALTGSVRLEDGVHVGAGATIIPNISIGEWSIIGAGAAVIRNIPSYCTAVGIPARTKIKEGV